MNNEVVNKLMIEMIETAGAVKSFVVTEAPEVVQQLLAWTVWENVIWLGIAIILLCLAIWNGLKIFKFNKKYSGLTYDERQEGEGSFFMWFVSSIVLSLITLITTAHMPSYILEIVKISVAPKVWLLEYASSLVK